jgi:Flp pilus assembly protein CpaB
MSTTTAKTVRRLGGSDNKADQRSRVTVRPPSPTRHRRTGLIGLAVLLIVGSALIAGLLAVRLDSRAAVVVAARPIEIGQKITAADLSQTRVASEGLSLLPVAASGQVIGKYATQAIPPGRLLDAEMLSSQGYLRPGVVAVGVAVPAGRMPASGLQPGDRVQIVQVVDGRPNVLVESAVVSTAPAAARSSGSGGLLPGGSTQGPGAVATVIVNSREGPSVAAGSAADQLSLVLVERGSRLDR